MAEPDYVRIAVAAEHVAGFAWSLNALKTIGGPEAQDARDRNAQMLAQSIGKLCAALGGKFV